jgi:transposase InsO family protein
MTNKRMVKSITYIDYSDKFCEGCVLGKHSRIFFFKKKSYRAKMVLELVYTDIYGPITPNSLDKYWYFIIFIDEFSRITLVYFLKEKFKVFSDFKKFKLLVENLNDERIKILRSDRGGEFTSKEIMNFYEEKCIRRFLTVTHSIQQNKLAERKNQTIFDIIRIMLKSKNMPNKFWTEAMRCVVYL